MINLSIDLLQIVSVYFTLFEIIYVSSTLTFSSPEQMLLYGRYSDVHFPKNICLADKVQVHTDCKQVVTKWQVSRATGVF